MQRLFITALACLISLSLNAQCTISTDIVENDGKYYYKSSMNLVNGCINTYGSNSIPFDESKKFVRNKLTVKNGKLTYLESWYSSGQMQAKSSMVDGVPQDSQFFTPQGDFIDTSSREPNYFFNRIYGDSWNFLRQW